MISYLIDINVWVALTWTQHPHSGVAHRWFQNLGKRGSRLLFCRITQLGLLRLLTNSKVMGDSVVTIHAAWALYDRWLEDPRVEFTAEPRGIELTLRQTTAPYALQSATKAVLDSYLIAFAEQEGSSLVTLDKAIQSSAQLRQLPTVLLH
jgi:toxin-antitoxin system PIN domain toxin